MDKDYDLPLLDGEEESGKVEDMGFEEILHQVSFLEGRKLSLEDINVVGDVVWYFGKQAYRRYLFRELQEIYGLDPIPPDDHWRFRVFFGTPDC